MKNFWAAVAGSKPSGSGSSSGGSTDWLAKYTSCMRGQGIDIPDSTAGGAMVSSRDVATDAGKAADASCKKKLGQPPASLSGGDAKAQAQQYADALKAAACLRGKGYDVPDPKAHEALGISADVPAEALQACGLTLGVSQ